MTFQRWLLLGALFGAAGVALGALGAHWLEGTLKAKLDDAEQIRHRLEMWETAVRYHMYHALALVATGLIVARWQGRWLQAAAWAFLVGTLLFSGCLYAYVLDGPRPLVHVVPIGGVSLIVGWVLLAIGTTRL